MTISPNLSWALVLGLSACVVPAELPARADVGPELAPMLDGAQLYVSKGCAGCHNPLATSSKRNASFGRIRAAAGPSSQIEPMRSIDLVDGEIWALVAVLADGSSRPAPDRRRPFVKPLLLTRTELESRLLSIFRSVPGAEIDDAALTEVLEVSIRGQASFLGGHCNRYDECGVAEIDASQNPAASVVRSGLIMRACLDGLQISGVPGAVLAKAGLTPADPVHRDHLIAVWDVFAPGRPLPSAIAELVVRASAPRWARALRVFCRPTVLEAI